jgi:hypothetical protein
VWCKTIAFGTIRRPFDTFGVLSSFSEYSLRLFAFVAGPLFGGALGVFGSLIKDGLDGEEEFGEIDGGPFRKAANK